LIGPERITREPEVEGGETDGERKAEDQTASQVDPRRGSTDPEPQDDCGHSDGRKSHEGEEESGDADQETHILSLILLLG
jgi:hypothetical protein